MARYNSQEVCRFYLQNSCKFGSQCRNLHPPRNQILRGGHQQSGTWFDNGRNWDKKGQGGNRYGMFNQTGGGGNWQNAGNWRGGGNWQNSGSWKGGGGGGGGNRQGNQFSGGNWSQNETVGGANRGGQQSVSWWSQTSNRGDKSGKNWQRQGMGPPLFSQSSWNDAVAMVTDDRDPTTASEIAMVVKTDIKIWQSTGVWPLSCYTPSSTCPNLSHFQDYSMEEIRYLAYNANKSGAPQTYLETVKQLTDHQCLIWNQYQLITPEDAIKLTRPVLSPRRREGTLLSGSNDIFGSPVKDLFGAKATAPPTSQPTSISSATLESTGLTQAQLDAYLADKFIFGCIPEIPPPDNLCH